MTTIKKEHHLFCGRQWTLSVRPAAGREIRPHISEVVSLDDKTLQAAKLTDEEFNQLTSDERVRHVIEQSEYYGYSGNRVKECEELSRKFNALGYRTIALSGADNEEKR